MPKKGVKRSSTKSPSRSRSRSRSGSRSRSRSPAKVLKGKSSAKKDASTRPLSAYNIFLKEYNKKHPGLGKQLMVEAGKAWRATK